MKYLRIRWEAIMRGTCVLGVVVGRMVLKVWGLGAEGRIALGMFWKSERRDNDIHTERVRIQLLQCLTEPGTIYSIKALLQNPITVK